MRRRVFILAAALSLLLFVAMAALWARSYFVYDAVAGCISEKPTSEICVQALSNHGAISLRRFDLTLTSATAPPSGYRLRDGLHFDAGQEKHWKTGHPESGLSGLRELFAFDLWDGTYKRRPLREVTQSERDCGIRFPHWVVVLPAAVAPALWWRQVRKHRMRRRAGLCLGCGYDLRGTPDRCPECGAVPGDETATAV
jgi:hypothetical protein